MEKTSNFKVKRLYYIFFKPCGENSFQEKRIKLLLLATKDENKLLLQLNTKVNMVHGLMNALPFPQPIMFSEYLSPHLKVSCMYIYISYIIGELRIIKIQLCFSLYVQVFLCYVHFSVKIVYNDLIKISIYNYARYYQRFCHLPIRNDRVHVLWYRWLSNLSKGLVFVQFNICDCDNGKDCKTEVDYMDKEKEKIVKFFMKVLFVLSWT